MKMEIFLHTAVIMSIIIADSHAIPPACMRCAEEGLTCCYYRDDTTTDMILPISYIECKNISSFLGVPIATCFDEENVTLRFQKNLKAMFPGDEERIEHLFPIGGSRLRFALRGTIKHCVFLTHKGCLLPRSVRPLLCNIFPFWVYANGDITLFGNCNLAPSGMGATECLMKASISLTELYALYTMLRTFWGV